MSRKAAWGLVGIALLSGCTSLSSLQTARVMPPGASRFFVGGGLVRSSILNSGGSTNADGLPFVEGGARYGFIEKWDLGVKYTLPGMLSGDVKLNIYEDEAWAFALGFGVGYMAIENASTDPNAPGFKQEVLDVIVPVYLSYDASPGIGFYVSPRYIHREASSIMQLIGSALGLRFGNTAGAFVEIAAAADLKSDFDQVQLNLGVFFGNGPSVPTTSPSADAR